MQGFSENKKKHYDFFFHVLIVMYKADCFVLRSYGPDAPQCGQGSIPCFCSYLCECVCISSGKKPLVKRLESAMVRHW